MIDVLENAYQLITGYTSKTSRPGISDLITFDMLVDMHEEDAGDPYYWTTTPDVVMEHIIDSNEMFTVEYGWEEMFDSIRDYIVENGFVKDIDDEDNEEEEENDN